MTARSTLSIEELEEIGADPSPQIINKKTVSKMKLKPDGEATEVLDSENQLTKQQALVKQLYQQLQENKTQLPFDLPDLWSLLGLESDLESGPSNAESQHGTPMTASADSIRDHVGKELRALRIHMARSQAILTVLAKAAYTSPPVLPDKSPPSNQNQSKKHVMSQQSSSDSNNPYLTDLLPFDVWESSPEHSCRSSSQFSNMIAQKEMLPVGRLPQTKTQSLDHGPSCVRTPINSRKHRTLSCPILPSQSTLVTKGTQTESHTVNFKNEDNYIRSGYSNQQSRLQVAQMGTSSECSLSPNMSRHRSHSFLLAVRKGNPLLRDLPWDSTGSSADAETDDAELQSELTSGDRSANTPAPTTSQSLSNQHAGPPRKLFSLPEEEQEDPHSPEAFTHFRRVTATPPPPRPRLPPPYRPPPLPCSTAAALSRSTPLLLSWTTPVETSSARCGPYSLEDLCHYGQPPSYQSHEMPYADFYQESPIPCCNHRHDAAVFTVPVTTIAAPSVVDAPPTYRRHCVVPAVVVQNSVATRRSTENIAPQLNEKSAVDSPSSAVNNQPDASATISPSDELTTKKIVDKANTEKNSAQLQSQQTSSQIGGGVDSGDSHHFRRGSSRRRLGLSGSSSNPLIQRSSAVELDETDHPSKLPSPEPIVDFHSRPLLTSRNRATKPPRRTSPTGQILLDVETSETESAKNSGGSMESEPEHAVPATLSPVGTPPSSVVTADDGGATPGGGGTKLHSASPSSAVADDGPADTSATPLVELARVLTLPDDVADDSQVGDGPSPSLTDTFLGRLKLLRTKQSGLLPLTEKEVESKFSRLTLAVRTDKFTMEKRLELHRRQRDLAEGSVEKDLKAVKEKIDLMMRGCGDHDFRFQLTQLQQQVNNVKQSAAKVSSRAEVYGAVQQEDRLSQTVDIMLMHVDNIKKQHDKLQSELDQARQFLRENNIASPRGSPNTSCGGGTHKTSLSNPPRPPMSRRRASVASIPRFFLRGPASGSSDQGDFISASEVPMNKRRPSICSANHPFSNISPLLITSIKERNKDSTVHKLNLTALQDLKEIDNESSPLPNRYPPDVPLQDELHRFEDLSVDSRISADVTDQRLALGGCGWSLLRDDDNWGDEDDDDDDLSEGRGESRTPAFDSSPYHMDRWQEDGQIDSPDDEVFQNDATCSVKSFSWPNSGSPFLELWLRWYNETDTVVQLRWAVGVALVFAALCCLVYSFLPRRQSYNSCSSTY